jgi:hypothetical protein
MKTFENQIKGNVPEIIRHRIKIIPAIAVASIFFLCISNITVSAQIPQEGVNVVPPPWAPYYENVNMVRYYYIPDIECYYDVWNHEFVYLEDGSWMFGATLPSVYSWLDLNTAFIVLLDYNVFEPWMHFHYYVSHYPRYYYRTFFRDNDNDINHPIRGFNENGKIVTYNNPRNVTRAENKTTIIDNNKRDVEINRNENKREPSLNREYPERRVEPTRPPQRMQYYGRNIGRPVGVQRNMMRPQGAGHKGK